MDTKVPAIAKEEMANEFHEMAMTEDISLLRQPMRTALTGFLEAKKAYENGTDEVRRLLLHECSIIYECNVCRNMFRSLVNFISHKRIYCKLSAEGNQRPYSDHNSSVIIQPTEQRSQAWFSKSRSTGSSPIPTKTSSRDLSKVIERLRRTEIKSTETLKDQNDDSKRNEWPTTGPEEKQELPGEQLKPEQNDPILQLESVPTSTQAVYQTLKPFNAKDSIRTEVNEVHNLLTNQKTMIGPDGKAIVSNSFLTATTVNLLPNDTREESSLVTALDSLNELKTLAISDKLADLQQQQQPEVTCEMCQMTFQTEKTLNIHIQKKHNSSTYVFQCPTCSLTFLQPAAVIRHLANEHKKPLKRIRKMRESILKKRIQIGNVQVKGPCRELKGLQLDSTKDLLNGNNENVLSQPNGKPVSTCRYCQHTFEKRAAFATHLASCSAKNETAVKKEVQTKIRVATKEEIHTKLKNQSNKILDKSVEENQNNEPEIKTVDQKPLISKQETPNHGLISYFYDCDANHLNGVNIKQEPHEDEFNSNSTHATNGSDINEMFENLEKQTFGEGLQTVSLDLMVSTQQQQQQDTQQELMAGNVPHENGCSTNEMYPEMKQEADGEEQMSEESAMETLSKVEIPKKKPKGFRTVPVSKQLTCRCKICNKQFNALSNLRRHISMFHYRARRFGCSLCDYRAFRRYDIVNHLSFVHKMQGERESMAVEFVTMHDVKYSKDDVEHDIVVVNEAGPTMTKTAGHDVKTYENKGKRKKEKFLPEDEAVRKDPESESPIKIEARASPAKCISKAVRSKLRKALSHEVEMGQRRPIRNRIKTVNSDFVYDLSSLKEEPREQTIRIALKRRNTVGMADNKGNISADLAPPIKIVPYRLRTEPLVPTNKESVKGYAARIYRNVVQEALAAPSTLPELPAERPLMRPRLSLPCRSDSLNAPVIEATELEVARLESTFFDDSFLEKFAKKSNPSFKMKPLLALQHSPLNSILQKFENNCNKVQNSENSPTHSSQENGLAGDESSIHFMNIETTPPKNPTLTVIDNPLEDLHEHVLQQMDSSPPNGAHILESTSPPSTPKKRITLMQRLAENRARRRDPLLRNALEN
ncbi:uncharacterized protein LOC101888282 [Musca domestica]|uniref:Uncharacterized protein LOC101888282 n=1 Tax=Musca domestica TaxID=7370 RepID=A0A9J7CI80_MUSDO|nr:uncharacterized protein LOC101888282 [Musca domestica]